MFADTGKSFNELNVLTSPGSKGSKFERGGHGMVYFSNATFQLAWTLGIYVWLVCSAKFPAKTISGQFCKRTVQFLIFVRKLCILCFISYTHCLDALFETKCFINLSCGHRNLTSDQVNKWPKPTAVIEKALHFNGDLCQFFVFLWKFQVAFGVGDYLMNLALPYLDTYLGALFQIWFVERSGFLAPTLNVLWRICYPYPHIEKASPLMGNCMYFHISEFNLVS